MLRLYNTALLPVRAAILAWAVLRSNREAGRREWSERRARTLPRIAAGGVWIHGSSLGEARIVAALARALRQSRPARPLAVSAFTPAGRNALPAPPAVDAAYFLPLDIPSYCRRLLAAVRPATLALVETELWPNLLAEAARLRVPVVVLNGRLSAERMARYRRLKRLFQPLILGLRSVGAQTASDAARFVELGLPAASVEVTGNVKYDLPAPPLAAPALRERLGLDPRRAVFVAGSTGRGEDELVLQAYRQIRAAVPDLLLILAPRHLERTAAVERLLRSAGLETLRLSRDRAIGTASVLLVDTHGELAALYQLAGVAFVGGSLVPIGGHNLLEPAAAGVPLVFGPYTQQVAEMADALVERGAGRRVGDAAELARTVSTLLGDAEQRRAMVARATALVQENRGALARSVALLERVLHDPATRSDAGAA